jgi:hypothetical protein
LVNVEAQGAAHVLASISIDAERSCGRTVSVLTDPKNSRHHTKSACALEQVHSAHAARCKSTFPILPTRQAYASLPYQKDPQRSHPTTPSAHPALLSLSPPPQTPVPTHAPPPRSPRPRSAQRRCPHHGTRHGSRAPRQRRPLARRRARRKRSGLERSCLGEGERGGARRG